MIEVTLEENTREMNRLKFEVADAISRRDYRAAELFQRSLEERMELNRQMLEAGGQRDRSMELERLNRERFSEEKDLLEQMREKSQSVLVILKERLRIIQETHKNELIEQDIYFSGQNFALLRNSPEITAVKKAEYYYSLKHDFHMATVLKNQIDDKIMDYIESSDRSIQESIRTRIESTIYRQEKEKKAFKISIENEKNRLKKKAMNEYEIIANKYMKLYQRVIKQPKLVSLTSASFSNKLILREIDHIFDDFSSTITLISLDIKNIKPPSMPMSARVPLKRLVPPVCDTVKIKNPRVAHAIGRSLMKRDPIYQI